MFCFDVETELNGRNTAFIHSFRSREHLIPCGCVPVSVNELVHSQSLGTGKGRERSIRSGYISFIIVNVEEVVRIKSEEVTPGALLAAFCEVVEAPLYFDKFGCHHVHTEKGFGVVLQASDSDTSCDSVHWTPTEGVSGLTGDDKTLSHLHSVSLHQDSVRNEARHLLVIETVRLVAFSQHAKLACAIAGNANFVRADG